MSRWICLAAVALAAAPLISAQRGAAVTATLSRPIDTKTNKAGDTVVFKLGQPVKSGDEVVLPSGSKITAHLTEVKSPSSNSNAELTLAFDKAVSSQGRSVPVNVSIASIARPQASSAPSDADGRGMGIPSVAAGSPSTPSQGGKPVGAVTNNPARNKAAVSHTKNTGPFNLHVQNGVSVISSRSGDIRLDSTTQFLLQVKPEK